ncbi:MULTISPECIES: DeoR/GlpR family DNA-binding transcription regulator [Staphylococcus]|uniref:DeoR/GlpR family DNA-binding transcription regulator n=1 Tax=Staphylococcus TaxID=1279 RepID=UPI0006197C62|nr:MULTISPECIES: DeoR/GlpR family DNA-binding transcription regulator [Staphylococcus]KKD23954.1 DeoR faimly transcriptional regulator [Staphylococcus cohnii subsp. cohnii]PTG48271.1 DeoR/GlpR transcriptional regulator [Staphylococcus cohnii]KKD25901.1 DeoR faimly transcriptional regulator [Staphylococcus cohnii subsp. cohnii]MDQ7111441.1 DeoR/GlpR family DNA-binding transcription regulator [Staphylococcus ureilyticus]MDU9348361.1 DeoR/GlpR family DNA-binding transcription regulator [Staphyloc
MLPTERRRKILDLLEKREFLKLKSLKDALQISMETLRRDVQQLVKDDLITKEYGGIRLKHVSNGESIIEQRLDLNIDKKNAIALKAIAEISDGDCIFLDSGSTTLQIAKHLNEVKNLTIITNSIPVMLQALNQGHTIISIGGKVRQSEHSITSFDFLFNFDQLNIDKAFICCSGISLDKGVTDFNLEEVETRRKILDISKYTYLTADSTKIDKVVTVKICDISSLDFLISDKYLESKTASLYNNKIKIL